VTDEQIDVKPPITAFTGIVNTCRPPVSGR